MSIESALAAGREAAEARMLDACTMGRPGGAPITDPDTGVVTQQLDPVYTGKCGLQQTLAGAANPVSGGHKFTVQSSSLSIPVAAGPARVGDIVTITAAAQDPFLAGRTFRVEELLHKTNATAQRLRVSEIVE